MKSIVTSSIVMQMQAEIARDLINQKTQDLILLIDSREKPFAVA